MSDLRLDAWASTVRARLSRDPSLDRLRGLAIACMLVDHVCIVAGGPYWLRMTVGRLALPLFFVIAGHLARRWGWRHAGIGLVGAFLPALVPWIDSPNVLLIWCVGVLVMAGLRWARVPLWLLAAVALAAAANGFQLREVGAFDVLAVWGLMALGSMLPRSAFAVGGRLPALLGVVGRHPVAWYVGHLLALQLLVSLTSPALGG